MEEDGSCCDEVVMNCCPEKFVPTIVGTVPCFPIHLIVSGTLVRGLWIVSLPNQTGSPSP